MTPQHSQVFIIYTYGCHTRHEDPAIDKQLEGYRKYLDKAISHIRNSLPNPVIFCKSLIQEEETPCTAEPLTIARYTCSHLTEVSPRYMINGESIKIIEDTTEVNTQLFRIFSILYRAITEGINNNKLTVTIFCKKEHVGFVGQLCRNYFAPLPRKANTIDIQIETADWN